MGVSVTFLGSMHGAPTYLAKGQATITKGLDLIGDGFILLILDPIFKRLQLVRQLWSLLCLMLFVLKIRLSYATRSFFWKLMRVIVFNGL